jgi:hypothetical protein
MSAGAKLGQGAPLTRRTLAYFYSGLDTPAALLMKTRLHDLSTCPFVSKKCVAPLTLHVKKPYH